jgi:hypothetical protein
MINTNGYACARKYNDFLAVVFLSLCTLTAKYKISKEQNTIDIYIYVWINQREYCFPVCERNEDSKPLEFKH